MQGMESVAGQIKSVTDHVKSLSGYMMFGPWFIRS